ncbi:type III restriction protein res subunit (plasmid) [Deinococcus proteolyticus MRP]|uniref:Type III restriction protein res subunit n=1 Tax=Deinococcus proteolyticus (strain ATCC 35074 / DSM 20540 / JCM 6276 / NBRC 101906 / NCIMB 13154 / VKM Ac-1939 / CCM 2703 / MRP) TaxID=693977 RepID=F0RQ89_DEIPM|nr:DEAD/DEAH box helicase family protein [Deinococcus proteolyticus]ADY27448.1 type III restriction protein res subunit [Deinococcus proteolyticus MRP]
MTQSQMTQSQMTQSQMNQSHSRLPAGTPCIYRLDVDGETYFGATKHYARRTGQHRRALETGKHHNPFLQQAFDRSGGAFSSRIMEAAPLEHLAQLEQRYLDEHPGAVNIERVSSLLPRQRKTVIRRGWAKPGIPAAPQAVMTPRPNQTDAETAVLEAMKHGDRAGLVRSPCGTGKTKLAALLGNHFGRCLFITHTDVLVSGTLDALQETWPGHHTGVIKAEEHFIAEKWTVASLPTLARRLAEIPPTTFDLIVCDEAHIFGAGMGTAVMRHFRPRFFAGLTATPERYSGTPLPALFGRMIYDLGVADAIAQGLIVPMEALDVRFKLRRAKMNRAGDDYDDGDVAAIMGSRQMLDATAAVIRAQARGQTLVYAATRKHARQLAEAIGERAVSVTGQDADRHERIQAFQRGETEILVSCRMLSYGFDAPQAETVVLAVMTCSQVNFTQIVGRGMRTAPGKTGALLLDLGGNIARGMRIDPHWQFSVRKLDPLQASQPGSRAAALDDENVPWELDGDVTVDVCVLGRDLLTPPALPAVHVSAHKPATERQRWLLGQLGYQLSPTLSRRQAATLIGAQPASQRQLKALAAQGYDPRAEWTYMQARAVAMRSGSAS